MRRRRTSGWIAGTLGAGLTASIVLAQQIPSTGVGPRAGSGASGPSSSEPPSLYGAAGERGARYLLRNGLDYLQYQQYERALKFLRDAEAKEKELGAKERQDLKRGIEQAQAGLRASADGSPAYALSDRSKRRGGFTPALPDPETAVASRRAASRPDSEAETGPGTTVAARTEWAGPTPRARAQARRPAPEAATTDAVFGAVAHRGGRPAAEEMPGEPIRLASAEATSPSGVTPTPGAGVGVGAGGVEAAPSPSSPSADPQEARGEIPALAAPGIPTLTAVPSSPDAGRPKALQDQATEPAAAASAPAPAPEPAAELVAPTQAPGGPAAPESTAPAPIPAGSAPAPILLETPDSATNAPAPAPARAEAPPAPAAEAPTSAAEAPTSAAGSSPAAPPVEAPASTEAGAAPSLVPTPSDSAPPASSSSAPPTGGLVPAALNGPVTPAETAAPPANEGSTSAPAGEPATATAPTETVAPLPPLGAAAARPVETGGAPHREDEPPAAAPATGAMAPEVAASPAPASGGDDLPPLPSDLSRDGGSAPRSPAGLAPAPAPVPPAPGSEPAGSAEAPRVALGAATTSPEAVPTPAPAADESLPPLPDEAGPRPGAAAPAPNAAAAAAPAGAAHDPAAEAPAPVAVPSPAPDGPPAGTAEERPVPVPQPEAGQASEPASPTAPPAGSVADEAPAPEAVPAAGAAPVTTAGPGEDLNLPQQRVTDMKKLRPEQERSIAEAMARIEREEMLRTQNQGRSRLPAEGAVPVREGSTSNLQTQTQYDIARAPSPAEARPIKAIPVPEDWVPLAPRSWTPQRKYWAAAATCHLPLYFQDPMLERYGHSVEQFFGPAGRYMTYPVDDPKQSTQRMQLLQPVFSLGLFAFQIGVWPYTAVVDAPWEAQYDLGYYRPGDVVPTDVYWLPLHGYGPPLHGDHY